MLVISHRNAFVANLIPKLVAMVTPLEPYLKTKLCIDMSHTSEVIAIFMATLRSRCGHYIYTLWFVSFSSFFSLPNFSGRGLDVYHTCTHSVALERI